jgi:tRNA (Thr-GGU) A37 N-methylase
VFHQNNNYSYTKAKVKPPRLDGAKVGLFSTRCPYRPNPIGLTLAKIENIEGKFCSQYIINICLPFDIYKVFPLHICHNRG